MLSVTAVTPADQITVHNGSGATVVIAIGARLLNVSSRPIAYDDALGSFALGSTVEADAGGRVTCFLPNDLYDYIVIGNPPAVDANSKGTLTSATNTMSWNHTASGESRAVIVGIAWQESTATETLSSVRYDGVAMDHVGTTSKVDLYLLLNPPTGTKLVLATWSGSNAKGAVGGAVSLTGVYFTSPVGVLGSATGTGTVASLHLSLADRNSLLVETIATNSVPGVTALSFLSDDQQWSDTGGTAPAATRTQGVGATRFTGVDALDLYCTLAASRQWGMLALEALPGQNQLFIDQQGDLCPQARFGTNVTHYATVQAAIDALPAQGGVVYFPAGTYRLRDDLVIDKANVTLIGEGATTILTPFDPANPPPNLVSINQAECRLERLTLDGAASAQDLTSGNVCLALNGLGLSGNLVQHCFLENVIVRGAARYGIWMQDAILLTAINCEVVSNFGTGLRITATTGALGATTTLRFVGCAFGGNGGVGVDIGLVSPDTGNLSLTFLGCTFEGNLGTGFTLADFVVGLNANVCSKLEIIAGYFEEPPTGCVQYVRLERCANAVVESCWFDGGTVSGKKPARAASFVYSGFGRFTSNTGMGLTSELVEFDVDSPMCLEYCNRDLDTAGEARIVMLGRGDVGMSRASIALPRVADTAGLPSASAVSPGSILWVNTIAGTDSHLRISDGTNWKQITLV